MIRRRRWQPSRSPGRSRISRKAIAQGRPDDPPVPVVLPRAFFLHADHGCGRHPAFPAPSVISRAGHLNNSDAFVPRECEVTSLSPVVPGKPTGRANARPMTGSARPGTHTHRQMFLSKLEFRPCVTTKAGGYGPRLRGGDDSKRGARGTIHCAPPHALTPRSPPARTPPGRRRTRA
jgi:hypothetical protein